MEGFNAFCSEVLFEELIEGESAGNPIRGVSFVNFGVCTEVFTVKVGSTEEVVMREQDGTRRLKPFVKA